MKKFALIYYVAICIYYHENLLELLKFHLSLLLIPFGIILIAEICIGVYHVLIAQSYIEYLKEIPNDFKYQGKTIKEFFLYITKTIPIKCFYLLLFITMLFGVSGYYIWLIIGSFYKAVKYYIPKTVEISDILLFSFLVYAPIILFLINKKNTK